MRRSGLFFSRKCSDSPSFATAHSICEYTLSSSVFPICRITSAWLCGHFRSHSTISTLQNELFRLPRPPSSTSVWARCSRTARCES